MELSVSILGIKKDIKERIKELNKLDIDYLHIDVMDGKFVPNKTLEFEKVVENLENNQKMLDIHLMVEDVMDYIKHYEQLKPEYITFHYEIAENIDSIISYLKSHNIKVGIAIKPSTDPALLLPYLDKIDLVLVMTVEPGLGGQKFMKDMEYKIKDLIEMRQKGKLRYRIEVDGGINNETIDNVRNVSISVVGSYITSSPSYKEKVKVLKEKIK